MGPLILQKDDVDKVPKAPIAAPKWGTKEQPSRLDWRVVAVLCVFAVVSLLVLYWLFGADVRDWIRYGDGGMLVRFAVYGGLVAVCGAVARRLLLVEQPGGFRVPLWQLDARRVVDGSLEVQRTYAGTAFRNVAAYTPTNPVQAVAPAML